MTQFIWLNISHFQKNCGSHKLHKTIIILWKHIAFQDFTSNPMTELEISNHRYQVTFFFTMISLWNLSPINIHLLSMLPIYGVHVEFHFTEKYVPYIKNKPKILLHSQMSKKLQRLIKSMAIPWVVVGWREFTWNLGLKFFQFLLVLVWMVGLLKWIVNSTKLSILDQIHIVSVI